MFPFPRVRISPRYHMLHDVLTRKKSTLKYKRMKNKSCVKHLPAHAFPNHTDIHVDIATLALLVVENTGVSRLPRSSSGHNVTKKG
jgi:hypothetical protein